jgi:hypothetical protein
MIACFVATFRGIEVEQNRKFLTVFPHGLDANLVTRRIVCIVYHSALYRMSQREGGRSEAAYAFGAKKLVNSFARGWRGVGILLIIIAHMIAQIVQQRRVVMPGIYFWGS